MHCATVARMVRRRLAVAAAVAAVVLNVVIFEVSRTAANQSTIHPTAPQTTGSSQLTFDAPTSTAAPINATTTTGAPFVSWSVGGSCSKSRQTFLCKVTVMASNDLQSGGFIDVFPAKGYDAGCESRGEISQDSATISGTCEQSFAASVLAVYSATESVNPSLAQSYLPWSPG